jgi:hypothetical protein
MANIASNKTKPPTIFLGMFPPQTGIADFRLLMDIGRSCHTTSAIHNRQLAIVNRQSARRGGAMKTRSLVAAVPRCGVETPWFAWLDMDRPAYHGFPSLAAWRHFST